MSKHTQGVWIVGATKLKIFAGEGEEQKQVASVGIPYYLPEAEANARLIATAPELLEACKDALGHLQIDKRNAEKNEHQALYIEKYLQPEIDDLKQAIAKAEGV